MLTNTYPHFLEVRALPLEEPTNVELVQELLDMRILQQKLPSVTKSHVSPIIAAIKARVNKPPAKSELNTEPYPPWLSNTLLPGG